MIPFVNGPYKDFLAKSAMLFASQMLNRLDKTSKDYSKAQVMEDIARDAFSMAATLGEELINAWGNQKTSFFDVQESIYSNLEDGLADITVQLEDIKEELKNYHER